MKLNDIVTLKDIPVSKYLELDFDDQEVFEQCFGELGTLDSIKNDIATIRYVLDVKVEFPLEWVELIVAQEDINITGGKI